GAFRAFSLPPWFPPTGGRVGLDGLEPSTSSLSGMRSNRLSYRPFYLRQRILALAHRASPSSSWPSRHARILQERRPSTIGRPRLVSPARADTVPHVWMTG